MRVAAGLWFTHGGLHHLPIPLSFVICARMRRQKNGMQPLTYDQQRHEPQETFLVRACANMGLHEAKDAPPRPPRCLSMYAWVGRYP